MQSPEIDGEREEEKVRTKKSVLHKLPYTAMLKSGTIRLASEGLWDPYSSQYRSLQEIINKIVYCT